MPSFPIVKDRKIRVGLVGCGRISKNHFGSFEQHADDIELVAVCDIDDTTLQAHSKSNGVPGFSQLTDMLDRVALDLVVLCTPSGLHPEHAVLAARHKVSVVS